MKETRRGLWFILSTVMLCALLGGAYGRRVEATTSEADYSDVQSSLKSFTSVYEVVQKNYADPVDPDKAIFGPTSSGLGAIPAALRTLDPHSNFFDPQAFSQLREEQEGKYYGVGMSISQRPGKMGKLVTIVLQPMPGSPAFRAGLRPGDVIMRVNDKPTEGMTTSQVAGLLKGPKGTLVHVTVSREGAEALLTFDITRDEISRPTVDSSFLLRPGIGYVHIANFNERTNDELSAALKRLDARNLQGLVLDLRGNPGGLLQEAVEVTDHFLDKNQLIVYHNGRRSSEKRYYATKGNSGSEYPIVVLVNRLTASAAEILAGALQDHDRALVLGEPSFGKGLVQTVYNLSEGTGMALTTAHYYTPSGRLIQRDYSNVSLYDYYNHAARASSPHDQVRLTDGGREVYGGGGITPDIRIDDDKLTTPQETLLQRGAFFNFGKYYLGIHQTIPRDFQVTDAVLDEFKTFLKKENIDLSDQNLKDNTDFVKVRIRLQLVAAIYGETEADRISVESDPLVLKALEDLPQARELLANAKKYIASKAQK